ncbi:hypothetical protein ACFW3Z_19930 [Nocardiopsis alba]|uniref:hypothetical protein n=1 Tax=Nocardiopsis alba TaxID=53437 RepID=UPI00366B31E5
MNRLTLLSLVTIMAAGCSSTLPPAADPVEEESATTITESTPVRMLFTYDANSMELYGLDYEITVTLGEAMAGAPCDLRPPEGTVTVPVTLTLVNTHDPDTVEAGAEEPERWVAPRYLAAEPVNAPESILRWEPPRSGYRCTESPDLESFVSRRWEPREQATLTGYLIGAPQDHTGSGIQLEFARDLWEIQGPEPEPFVVTYPE